MHIEFVRWAALAVAVLLPILLTCAFLRNFDSPAFDVPLSIFVAPVIFWGACLYLFFRLASAF